MVSCDSQTKLVSVVKAPASLNSPLVSTQYIRCGDGLDHGAGRFTIVRNIYSLPIAGGNSPTGERLNIEVRPAECDSVDGESVDSASPDIVDCSHNTHIT